MTSIKELKRRIQCCGRKLKSDQGYGDWQSLRTVYQWNIGYMRSEYNHTGYRYYVLINDYREHLKDDKTALLLIKEYDDMLDAMLEGLSQLEFLKEFKEPLEWLLKNRNDTIAKLSKCS